MTKRVSTLEVLGILKDVETDMANDVLGRFRVEQLGRKPHGDCWYDMYSADASLLNR